MGFIIYAIKLIISIILDILDFFMPPGIATIYDIICGFIGLFFWKGKGAVQFIEIIDITGRISPFIPTLTIMGLLSIGSY
ncbi:MAG: hypothetical protein MAG795_00366 [Candidatus Woesearchaeota archaeon]|nr:hypothetical protein [Candidatus Woesearchaeota archaeon]